MTFLRNTYLVAVTVVTAVTLAVFAGWLLSLALAERNRHRPAHRVTVWHKPWEKVTAKMIDAAFVAHFCAEYQDERCEAIT